MPTSSITNQVDRVVRNIADTARWVAHFRALESQRPDALFVDPYAARLAGERGSQIAETLEGDKRRWAWATRTYLFDRAIERCISAGADVVLNLAAGLDTRAYRMSLSPGLRWIELDLPEILSYKEHFLQDEPPRCGLERIALDLRNVEGRRELFRDLNRAAKRVLVVAEGLLVYLADDEVGSLSQDLSSQEHFRNWIIDLASPGQLRLMQSSYGKNLSDAGAELKFAPLEGPKFFRPYGWQAIETTGILKTAAELKRAPTELLALLPEPEHRFGNYPWTGVCLLENCRSSSS